MNSLAFSAFVSQHEVFWSRRVLQHMKDITEEGVEFSFLSPALSPLLPDKNNMLANELYATILLQCKI